MGPAEPFAGSVTVIGVFRVEVRFTFRTVIVDAKLSPAARSAAD